MLPFDATIRPRSAEASKLIQESVDHGDTVKKADDAVGVANDEP